MLYRISKTFRFEASHQLPNHDGKCANLHGHSWEATITIEGYKLVDRGPKNGMLMDFHTLDPVITKLTNLLDHRHLNDIMTVPTSEIVANYIAHVVYDWLVENAKGLGVNVYSVGLKETCTCKCEVFPSFEVP